MAAWLIAALVIAVSGPTYADDSDLSAVVGSARAFKMSSTPAPEAVPGPVPAPHPTPSPTPVKYCQDCAVLPIVIVAADYSLNGGDQVKQGAAAFTSAVKWVQAWYRSETGRTFAVLPAETIASKLTSDQWLTLSCQTATPDERKRFAPCNQAKYDAGGPQVRYAYYEKVKAEFLAKHSGGEENRRFIITVYAGPQPDAWLGAADGEAYAVAAPRSASVSCPDFSKDPSGGDEKCRDSAYGIAHELGHSFGLAHACEQSDYPKTDCEHSFMQAQHPPGMTMLDGEMKTLLRNKFFALFNIK